MRDGGLIRALQREDLGELVELCREHAAFERAAFERERAVSVEGEREDRLAALFLGNGAPWCWVVDGEDELAGFATASLELSTWDAAHYLHVDCLYLRPPYRRRGLGRDLFAQIAGTALERDAVDVQWQTPAWNEDAAHFYRRLGARPKEKLRFTLGRTECATIAGKR